MKYFHEYQSPLGKITLGGNEDSLGGLWFEGQKYFGAGLDGSAVKSNNDLFSIVSNWLDLYFSGKNPDINFPIMFNGTDFRNSVWKFLLKIPYGQTISYNEIAKALTVENPSHKTSARAVGGAVGHNPVSIIIPCHRVVGSSGSLTGYAGGIERKTYLLSLENSSDSGL